MLTGLLAYNQHVGRAYRLMLFIISTLNVLTGLNQPVEVRTDLPAYNQHVERAYGLTCLQ